MYPSQFLLYHKACPYLHYLCGPLPKLQFQEVQTTGALLLLGVTQLWAFLHLRFYLPELEPPGSMVVLNLVLTHVLSVVMGRPTNTSFSFTQSQYVIFPLIADLEGLSNQPYGVVDTDSGDTFSELRSPGPSKIETWVEQFTQLGLSFHFEVTGELTTLVAATFAEKLRAHMEQQSLTFSQPPVRAQTMQPFSFTFLIPRRRAKTSHHGAKLSMDYSTAIVTNKMLCDGANRFAESLPAPYEQHALIILGMLSCCSAISLLMCFAQPQPIVLSWALFMVRVFTTALPYVPGMAISPSP